MSHAPLTPVRLGRCVVCRCEVASTDGGALFGAFGRPLFVACATHAPFVKRGLISGSRVAHRSLAAFARRKFPVFAKLVAEVMREGT